MVAALSETCDWHATTIHTGLLVKWHHPGARQRKELTSTGMRQWKAHAHIQQSSSGNKSTTSGCLHHATGGRGGAVLHLTFSCRIGTIRCLSAVRTKSLMFLPPAPCVTFRPSLVSSRGPGQSPFLPFAECVRPLLSARPWGWCVLLRLCVRGAQHLVCCGCGWCSHPFFPA